jgi:hypothetical protein
LRVWARAHAAPIAQHALGQSAGLEAALLEIYRAQFITDDRKLETLSRLRIWLRALEEEGHGAGLLARFIEKLEPCYGD